MHKREELIQKAFSKSGETLAKLVGENQICYCKGQKETNNIFDIEDLEDLLENPGIFDKIRFNKNGKDINAFDILDRHNSGAINIPAFLLHISKGETCILHQAEKRNRKLRYICAELTKILHSRISCNVYLTPANEKAFPPHTDPHDVLVLQVRGQKVWHISRGKDDIQSIIIRPKDILYIPKNTLHYAESSESNDPYSLHLTFVINKLYEEDLMAKCITQSMKKKQNNEAIVTSDQASCDENYKLIQSKVKDSADYINREVYANALSNLQDKRIDESLHTFDGGIESVLKHGKEKTIVDRNTYLRRANNLYRTSGGKNYSKIHLKNYELTIPFGVNYVNQLLRSNSKYQIKSIDNGKDESYLIIISEILIKRGVLVIQND